MVFNTEQPSPTPMDVNQTARASLTTTGGVGNDISFNPNSLETGDAWDAFDVATAGNGNDNDSGVDWNAFVNGDSAWAVARGR